MKGQFNEDFLMAVLRFYTQDSKGKNLTISKEAIQASIDKTISFLNVEDHVNNTDHEKIFIAIMVEQKINANNSSAIGISRRTYYRYKQRYLKIFGAYLQNYIIE